MESPLAAISLFHFEQTFLNTASNKQWFMIVFKCNAVYSLGTIMIISMSRRQWCYFYCVWLDCEDEWKKKVSESYSVIIEKLEDDLRLKDSEVADLKLAFRWQELFFLKPNTLHVFVVCSACWLFCVSGFFSSQKQVVLIFLWPQLWWSFSEGELELPNREGAVPAASLLCGWRYVWLQDSINNSSVKGNSGRKDY